MQVVYCDTTHKQVALIPENKMQKKNTYETKKNIWRKRPMLSKMCPVRVISKYGVITKLVGGFNPFEKYARQIGSFPQVGMKIIKSLKPPPRKSYWDILDKNPSSPGPHLCELGML